MTMDVTVDGGLRLHVEELAAGSAPAVVLLHGFGASTSTWTAVAPRLAARSGRRLLAFDRVGFGRSARPRRGDWAAGDPSPYRPSLAGPHTLAVMDALGVDRAVLVGHSAGAVGAVLAALEAPDRIAGLGLVAPALLSEGPPPLVAAAFRLPGMATLAPPLLRASVGLLGRGLQRSWHDPEAVPADVVERYAAAFRTPGWEHVLVELTRAVEPLDLADRLGRITAPAVVVAGASDRIVPLADSRRVSELLGGRSSLVVVPQAGHLVHEEQPDAVVEALLPLLVEQ